MNVAARTQAPDTESLKQIPKWTRTYAQNRTTPVLISLAIYLCLFSGIAIPSYFGSRALVDGDRMLTCVYLILLLLSMICLIVVSVPPWGTRIINRLTLRFHAQEGIATPPAVATVKKSTAVVYAVGLIFGACVLGHVALGFWEVVAIGTMQPLSALYVVPFVVFLYVRQRPLVGRLTLLFPVLYTACHPGLDGRTDSV